MFDPNALAAGFVVALTAIVAFGAAIAQVFGQWLKDPWERL